MELQLTGTLYDRAGNYAAAIAPLPVFCNPVAKQLPLESH